MASTEPAGPGEQPDSTAPRLVVVLARDGGESRVCRVDAPDRVLRIWALLNNASEELRQVDLPAGAAERLERQLGAFTAELERSVSPALGRELHELFPPREASAATARELRIEYAGLLGWVGSLVIGIFFSRSRRPPRGPQTQSSRPAREGSATARRHPANQSPPSVQTGQSRVRPVHHGRAEPISESTPEIAGLAPGPPVPGAGPPKRSGGRWPVAAGSVTKPFPPRGAASGGTGDPRPPRPAARR